MLAEHIGRYPSAEGLVFTAAEGGPVHHRNFRRRHFQPATGKAGLEGVRFHDLRHTCAALLIANGRHMEEVKDYLGHSSIRVTSDRYAHLFPKARAALAESLDATFRESEGLFEGLAAKSRCLRTRARGRLGPSSALSLGADDGTRTRDPNLGKVVLYQLSHVRVGARLYQGLPPQAPASRAYAPLLEPILGGWT